MIGKIGKLTLFLVFLCSSLLSSAQESNGDVIDKIVWIVGDEAILLSDIEHARRQYLSMGTKIEGDPYCFIPEQLAVQKLLLDQAKIDSVDIPFSTIERYVNQQEKNVIARLGSKEKVEEYMMAPMVQLKERWREEIRNGQMAMEAQNSIISKKGALTPSEVRKYYALLPKDSLPFIPTTVEIQIITNEPVIPQSEIDKVKEQLRGYTERVNNGQSFASLAIMYSEEPGADRSGGEIGFSGRAQFVPEFANVAFSLSDPKKVSNIVETEYGYHIIQLIERRGDLVNVRHILKRPKAPAEAFAESRAQLDTVVNFINSGKYTFDDATVFSFDKDTRNNNGLMVNRNQESPNSGTPRFRMEDLPVEISTIVDTMKVGQISAPFKLRQEKNQKEVMAIIKLKNRVEKHVANVSDDYIILKNIVESFKQQEALKKWLQNKIKETYIYIDKDWRNCDFQYSGWVKDDE